MTECDDNNYKWKTIKVLVTNEKQLSIISKA